MIEIRISDNSLNNLNYFFYTLSKHISFSLPETLMRGGEMQKMPLARRRL